MRHAKHRHQLGRKKEHREALMANLAAALIRNKRIKTTLPKAKALRPFIEKIITLAKKADATDEKMRKHHLRKLALSRVRDMNAVNRLFNDLAGEFTKREGGYTRIYKLVPRLGDAADMAFIELIDASDEGYSKRKSGKKPSAKEAEAAPAVEEAKEEVLEVSQEPSEETPLPTVAKAADAPAQIAEAKAEVPEFSQEPSEETPLPTVAEAAEAPAQIAEAKAEEASADDPESQEEAKGEGK